MRTQVVERRPARAFLPDDAVRQADAMRCFGKNVGLFFAVVCVFLGAGAARLRAQIQGAGDAPVGQRRPLTQPPKANRIAYTLQPGDTVDVAYRYTPEFNETLVVGPDGHAFAKAAGDLQVGGLTLPQLQESLKAASSVKLNDPEVVVTLKDFDKPHIFVAGEVNTPGRLDLRRPTTALQAILASGGPKDDAAMGRVLLFRRIDADTAEVHVLRLDKYTRHAREGNDMLLEPDDMLLVRHDIPSQIERYIKLANVGFYLNPLQNIGTF